jgi:hypothetical protein
MGKGVTVKRSLQRQLAPDKVGPEHVEPTFLQAISNMAGRAKAHRFQNLYGYLNESLLRKAWDYGDSLLNIVNYRPLGFPFGSAFFGVLVACLSISQAFQSTGQRVKAS